MHLLLYIGKSTLELPKGEKLCLRVAVCVHTFKFLDFNQSTSLLNIIELITILSGISQVSKFLEILFSEVL